MAFSGIPLPKVVYDVEKGGPIITGMQGANALTKSNLENQYYAPNILSEINKRVAETKGINITNQYLPEKLRLANALSGQELEWNPKNWASQNRLRDEQANEIHTLLQAKLDEMKIKADQNKIINEGLSTAFPNKNLGIAANPNNQKVNGNNSPNNMQSNALSNGSNINQSTPNNTNITPQNSLMQSPVSGVNKMTYPQAAIMNHLLGLGQPQIADINGKKLAITPWGNFTVAEGMSPQQESYQKGIGKYNAESYGKNVEAYTALNNQDVALDNMISALDNPEFYNVTGPVSSFLTNWAGTPERQQLLGNLRSSSGEIALQVAPSLKGAFTGRDQTLINTIKANPDTDMSDVFIGKLKAQKMIGSLLAQRAKLAAEYIDSGMSSLKANEKAVRETPLSKYKSEIDNLIKPKISLRNPNTGEIRRFNKDEIQKLIKDKKLKITSDQAKKLGVKI